jgi:hypothetical protein
MGSEVMKPAYQHFESHKHFSFRLMSEMFKTSTFILKHIFSLPIETALYYAHCLFVCLFHFTPFSNSITHIVFVWTYDKCTILAGSF